MKKLYVTKFFGTDMEDLIGEIQLTKESYEMIKSNVDNFQFNIIYEENINNLSKDRDIRIIGLSLAPRIGAKREGI